MVDLVEKKTYSLDMSRVIRKGSSKTWRASLCDSCGKEAHHIHHKDESRKNNEPSNLQPLCTLCHAKIHGKEPNISELKKLVLYYEKIQKARLAIQVSIKSFTRIGLDIPIELSDEVKKLKALEARYLREIPQYFRENPSEIYCWMISIKGIGNLMAAKVLAFIDLEKVLSVSSLWAYAGLTPDSKREKGKKSNWSHNLKRTCYQLAGCFIKTRAPKYREIYDREKAKQVERGIKKGHAHNRAIRKVAKVFLRDLVSRTG